MKTVRSIDSADSSPVSPRRYRWMSFLMLVLTSALVGGCFPPSQSGRPWYGERYVNTPQYQQDKAKHARQAREGGERAARNAAARREYEAQRAERNKKYETRSFCEMRNAERRRKALARGSQSYEVEDCSRYPR